MTEKSYCTIKNTGKSMAVYLIDMKVYEKPYTPGVTSSLVAATQHCRGFVDAVDLFTARIRGEKHASNGSN